MYADNTLSTSMNGTHATAPPLENVTIAGASCLPSSASLNIAGQPCEVSEISLEYSSGVLYVTGIEKFTPNGAWEGEIEMKLTF